MARYAAFLRGVTPMNARMPDLKACFEAAGFREVRTLLSSGNVVFEARRAAEVSLQRRIEAVMQDRLGQIFMPLVRGAEALQVMLAADPYQDFRLAANAKRIVTFLREAPRRPANLPLATAGVRILCQHGTEVYSAYEPGPRDPVFMSLIERTFGKQLTTRTWDTTRKVTALLGDAPRD